MVVLPLGLGTRFRFPVMTVIVVACWFVVGFVDRSPDRIFPRMLASISDSKIKAQTRRMFQEYCLKRKGDRRSCKKYSVLIWAGFPKSYAPGKDTAKDAWIQALQSQQDEIRKAEQVRDGLKNCRGRRCYRHKDIVWSFLENYRETPGYFASYKLLSYRSYLRSLQRYRTDLRKNCLDNDCLINTNISGRSLIASQFRHGGLLHLLSNALMMFIFGAYVEQRTNRFLYLGVVMLGGSLGLGLHAAFFDTGDVMALGGSANVSAVLGMFLVFFYRHNMSMLVWIPPIFVRSFRAPILLCVPLMFVLGDVIGGMQNGFSELMTNRVAHFAHLGGFATGVVAALLIAQTRKLPWPFIFEAEKEEYRELGDIKSLTRILDKAELMIQRNPENHYIMEYGAESYLIWLAQQSGRPDPAVVSRGTAFLQSHLKEICAIRVKRDHLSTACRVLSRMPYDYTFGSYLGSLGQISSLRLADHALVKGHPVLALRLYDFYITRYEESQKVQSIMKSAQSVLASIPATEVYQNEIQMFLSFHRQSPLAPLVADWLSQFREVS